VVPTPGRDRRVEEVHVEAHVQVGVVVHPASACSMVARMPISSM
jgi:hypothetical protein